MMHQSHKYDCSETHKKERDTQHEKLLRWEEISFQDAFETVCVRRVTNVAWNSVPYGRPCDSKSFVTILCSGR